LATDFGLPTPTARQFHPDKGFFTWWDFRGGHFHRFGMRIDHVYVSPPLAARGFAAERDRKARKPSTPDLPPTTPR
jgi:exodeoxyribonuclease III